MSDGVLYILRFPGRAAFYSLVERKLETTIVLQVTTILVGIFFLILAAICLHNPDLDMCCQDKECEPPAGTAAAVPFPGGPLFPLAVSRSEGKPLAVGILSEKGGESSGGKGPSALPEVLPVE
ncbi:uncharacterized protein LOC143030432 [Oratosquilla oratoria]|uniref:uncharacterized protein LOC143030432 n=1 Tax=Oratosquilla oratoria TaxID=337810 RepID=UPI003F762695